MFATVNTIFAPALPGVPLATTFAVYLIPCVFVPSIDVDNPNTLPAFVGSLTSKMYFAPLTKFKPDGNGLSPVGPTQSSGG